MKSYYDSVKLKRHAFGVGTFLRICLDRIIEFIKNQLSLFSKIRLTTVSENDPQAVFGSTLAKRKHPNVGVSVRRDLSKLRFRWMPVNCSFARQKTLK